MRIAYLINQYPKTSHSFVRREIQALESLGVEVDRFTVRRVDEPLPDPADRAELDHTSALLDGKGSLASLTWLLIRAAMASPGRAGRALALALSMARRGGRGVTHHLVYLAEAAGLAAELRRRGVSHVHAHFGTNSTTVAMLCSVLSGGTYSFTVHGPEEFDRPAALGLGTKIERAELVVAISDYGRSQLYRWCDHEHWPKIQVVHCTVDASFVAAEPDPVGASDRFVCVGRLCEQKGQLLLIEAAAELAKERSFELLLVGDGELREPIESLIAANGLTGTVRILGWKSSDEVREALRASRALILASFAEGLPVVIMEALALGRPVISTYVAGIPELVEPGSNGWLVPAGSVAELVAAMGEVLDASPEELTEMGRAGHEAVASRHRDSVEAEKLARHLSTIVEPQR